MPIHLRAEPGDYAEAVLLPGDPLRAKYIAETFFDNSARSTASAAMLGYTGTFEGKPISVQSSGMGCPSAAIVDRGALQLGVKRIVRVGTCGGLQPDMRSATSSAPSAPSPPTAPRCTYTGGEPHAPDGRLRGRARRRAPGQAHGPELRVGPCVAPPTRSTTPTPAGRQRWSDRGVLAVEMEAAVLFTIAALRSISAGCLLRSPTSSSRASSCASRTRS